MSQSITEKGTPVGRPAKVSHADYLLKLPVSPRRLGGNFSVDQAAEKLSTAFHLHHKLMRAIAGRLIGVAEFELKIELAHHLYYHAEAARALRERIHELRVPRARLEASVPEHVKIIVAELMLSESTAEFVLGLHAVLAGRLATFAQDYLDKTDGLVDLPSRRILLRILDDLHEMETWGKAVVNAFVQAGASTAELENWRRHLDHLIDRLGGLGGGGEMPLEPFGSRAEARAAFRRPIGCARDDRFSTFHHTRNYKVADAETEPEKPGFESDRLEVIRVQRDELDAIETFANVLFDFDRAPFEFEMALARFIWDEARHSEMGHQSLERLGYEPFEVPCGIIGINVRSPLPPLLAFAQINTFGELNQVGHLRKVSTAAYRAGDLANGRSIDFVHADESLHVREGRKWLRRLLEDSGTTIAEFEEEARLRAIQRLREEGVLGEDYNLNLTPMQLAEMLGE